MKTHERILYFDCLRIFSIFAMMMLHTSASMWFTTPVTTFEWQVFNIYDTLVRFCVPVFVMISGAIFLDESREVCFKKILSKNVLRIITSFLFWSLLYSLYVQINGSGFSVKLLFKSIVFGHYHLWFLFILVGLYLIIPFLRSFSSNKRLTEYFIVLFFVFQLIVNALSLIPNLPDDIIPLLNKPEIEFILGYSGYFVLGHYLSSNTLSKGKRYLIYLLAVLSLIGTILLSSLISIKTGTPNGRLYDNMLPTTFFVAIAVFVFFKYNISKIPFSETAKYRIIKLSNLTFGMYLVHDFINIIFKEIGFSTLSYNALISVPINTLLVFIFSFFIALFISKIPILNKYIM